MAAPSQSGSSPASAAWDKHAFRILALAALGVLAVGTVVYHYLEDWSWVDSLYFSVVAGTTVGFGDLAPTTDASKLFTIVYILSGITIIGTYLSVRFRYRGLTARTVHRVSTGDAPKTESETPDAGR